MPMPARSRFRSRRSHLFVALGLIALLLTPALVMARSGVGPHRIDLRPVKVALRRKLQSQKGASHVHRQPTSEQVDLDHDGLSTWTERHRTGTNPRKFDTDRDGYGDGTEVLAGTDPLNPKSHPGSEPVVTTPPPSEESTQPPEGTSPSTPSEEVTTTPEEEVTPPKGTKPPEEANPPEEAEPTPPADTTPPQTTIDSGPAGTTTSTSATFGFSSSESGSSFECKLDSGPWSACTSPKGYSSQATGAHAFSVRATDPAGNTDPTPAGRSWTIEAESAGPAGCTQTLASGANVSTAISNAASGAVICLNGGSGSVSLNAVHKSNVTLRGPGTLSGSTLKATSGVRLEGMHFTGGLELIGATHDIQVVDNEFTGEFGIRANGEAQHMGTNVTDVLIEGNYLHGFNFSGSEGVAGGYGMTLVNGVERFTIHANTIESVANDYIQSASPVDFTVDGNTFLGPSLRYTHPEVHQDLWQIFGGATNARFTNNVARNTGTNESLLFQEGTFHNTVVENNLLVNDSDGYTCQIYQQQGIVFRRNTIVDSHWGCLFRDNGGSAGSGYQVDHNIFVGTEENSGLSTQSRAGSWGTYDYNVSDDGSAGGSHSVRNWSPSWVNTVDYSPQGLPFAAGYEAP